MKRQEILIVAATLALVAPNYAYAATEKKAASTAPVKKAVVSASKSKKTTVSTAVPRRQTLPPAPVTPTVLSIPPQPVLPSTVSTSTPVPFNVIVLDQSKSYTAKDNKAQRFSDSIDLKAGYEKLP